MPEIITAETRQRIDKVLPHVPAFAAERGISDLGKVCNFLPVALGLRPLSLTYLPAELPGGARFGEAIDEFFASNYKPPAAGGSGGGMRGFFRKGRGGGDPTVQSKEAELLAKRKLLNDAYDKIVAVSPAYLAHLSWLEKLGLDQVQFKRRPTLREMFIYGDRSVRQQLVDLESVANAARGRRTTGKDQDPDQALMEYVYADEFDRDYLQGLGRLLGYPECCVQQYTEDRLKGQNVEQRAWEQVREAQEEGRPIDVRAYFVKDFFPCVPHCPEAIAIGERYEAAYAELGEEIRDIYTGAQYQSFEYIQNYPRLILQHRQRLSQGQQQH